MDVNIDGEHLLVRLSAAELHVVHAALHSYGDHQLATTLERDGARMSSEFHDRLQRVQRWAVSASEALGEWCGRVDHAGGMPPGEDSTEL